MSSADTADFKDSLDPSYVMVRQLAVMCFKSQRLMMMQDGTRHCVLGVTLHERA